MPLGHPWPVGYGYGCASGTEAGQTGRKGEEIRGRTRRRKTKKREIEKEKDDDGYRARRDTKIGIGIKARTKSIDQSIEAGKRTRETETGKEKMETKQTG
ncbi:hypothetical protein EVG20_g5190 [Dentipellis fragilis]|uniref:Uncharacterized protein n=1 Tax=Dentipellis fragilis TaxID=205917 RepID=A0A4Y9YVZ0_9AGAM|nr:hypothetical protein EVG20_g5190 [Dentipellis fragilis]